jgi:hypothetical protein
LHTSLSFTASFLPSRVATKIDQYYDVELSELQVKDESGNIVPNSSLNFEVKPDNDTSDLFSNGMTLNSLGQVIGTPVGGQDGTFKITATGKNSTD